MRYLLVSVCVAVALSLAPACDKAPPEELPELTPAPKVPENWIGVELVETRDLEGDPYLIRKSGYTVVVRDTVPGMPADGLFEKFDIIRSVNGRTVTTATQVIEAVRNQPAGVTLEMVVTRKDKEVKVSVAPIPRPNIEDVVRNQFLGKPMPPLSGRISVAETDGRIILPGSQCFAEGKKACPKIGRSGATTLALGKVTVVIFYAQDSQMCQATLAELQKWEQKYGSHGLKVVGITHDTPAWVAQDFDTVKPRPPMTVISMFWGDYGLNRLALYIPPTMFVLDEQGVVRGVSVGIGQGVADLRDKVLPSLFVERP